MKTLHEMRTPKFNFARKRQWADTKHLEEFLKRFCSPWHVVIQSMKLKNNLARPRKVRNSISLTSGSYHCALNILCEVSSWDKRRG